MFNEVKTLVIVYKEKDEMYVNALRKLIETKDDNIETGEVSGTTDGSIEVIAWTEKQWADQKIKVSTVEKVLFIGDDIKGVDKLIPLIDIKYDRFGIKYGWSGNQAIIYANAKSLEHKYEYTRFLYEVRNKINIESLKQKRKIDGSALKNLKEVTFEKRLNKSTEKLLSKSVGKDTKTVLKNSFIIGLTAPFSFWPAVGGLIKDTFDDKKLVRDQQYLLGVFELYYEHLEEFMQS